jgi:hypothetical protein
VLRWGVFNLKWGEITKKIDTWGICISVIAELLA